MRLQGKMSPTAAGSHSAPITRKVDIPAVRATVGMHVVGLDRPWEEVPVLFQSFVIENEEQVDILCDHCEWITIEETGCVVMPWEPAPPPRSTRPAPGFRVKLPLAEELPQASRRYHQARDYVDTLLHDVADNRDASLGEAREIVRSCVNSIANNANAMFWLTRIRDQHSYTAEHCVRVGLLAITFGRYLGLPGKDLEILGLSGMLHDVGKMRIAPEILNKPGALTRYEWARMRRHAEYGFQLLGSDHELEPEVREAALSHHERLDGRGYPRALSADDIGRTTRIISIVDAYDAMTSDRAYRMGIPASDALRVLYRYRDTQFDRELVADFIRMIGIYPPGSLVELDTGEVAVVLATSPQHKLHPLVEVVLDRDGRLCEPHPIDLSEQPTDGSQGASAITRALPDGSAGFSLAEHIRRLSVANSTATPVPR